MVFVVSAYSSSLDSAANCRKIARALSECSDCSGVMAAAIEGAAIRATRAANTVFFMVFPFSIGIVQRCEHIKVELYILGVVMASELVPYS